MIFIIISDLIVAVKRVRQVGWGLNRQKLNVKLNMTFVKSTYWTNVKVTHVRIDTHINQGHVEAVVTIEQLLRCY